MLYRLLLTFKSFTLLSREPRTSNCASLEFFRSMMSILETQSFVSKVVTNFLFCKIHSLLKCPQHSIASRSSEPIAGNCRIPVIGYSKFAYGSTTKFENMKTAPDLVAMATCWSHEMRCDLEGDVVVVAVFVVSIGSFTSWSILVLLTKKPEDILVTTDGTCNVVTRLPFWKKWMRF